VKKESTSPEPPLRHRPPKLQLNKDADISGGPTVPRTAGASLSTMRDVGMACLSPGFATQDPTMREQLQRSISVRDQQRSIIEARLQRHAKPGSGGKDEPASARGGSSHTPKRRPPNSLTIVPPPHQAFANERVVQSAPLNQSFTGRRRPSSNAHLPPQRTHNPPTINRLPPISDVFGPERLDGSRTSRLVDPPQTSHHYYPSSRAAQPSPSNLAYARPREHRSAEEALQMMSGGREELLPRIIHYGGHQPPTPPSPLQAGPQHTPSKPNVAGEYVPPLSAGRRRTRAEYEQDNDSYAPGSRDSPETKRRKKDEFLTLCARAWELFHS
jgi:hypothetical protein